MTSTALSDSEINAGLASLDGWEYLGGAITKTYTFKTYGEGLAFASAAGVVAEGINHHPDILIGYRKVTLTFTTHDAGSSVTQKDIDTAAAVEGLGFPRKG